VFGRTFSEGGRKAVFGGCLKEHCQAVFGRASSEGGRKAVFGGCLKEHHQGCLKGRLQRISAKGNFKRVLERTLSEGVWKDIFRGWSQGCLRGVFGRASPGMFERASSEGGRKAVFGGCLEEHR
jgi:hypothetical protein